MPSSGAVSAELSTDYIQSTSEQLDEATAYFSPTFNSLQRIKAEYEATHMSLHYFQDLQREGIIDHYDMENWRDQKAHLVTLREEWNYWRQELKVVKERVSM